MIRPESFLPAGKREISRRGFLKLGAAAAGYFLLESSQFGWALKEAHETGFEFFNFPMYGFPPEWNGTVIVHMSDLHIAAAGRGFFTPTRAETLAFEIKTRLKEMRADPDKTFIINTGDIVSSEIARGGSATRLKDVETSFKSFAKIPSAGLFAVPGNHEEKHPLQGQLWELLADFGYYPMGLADCKNLIQTQIPDSQTALPFVLVGAPDYTTQKELFDRRELLEPSLYLTDANIPTIFATHNASVADVLHQGYLYYTMTNNLGLSGHTHGGQIKDGLLAQHFARDVIFEYLLEYDSELINGIYQLDGDASFWYVSSGLGYSESQIVRTVKPKVSFFILSSGDELIAA